MVLVQRLNRCRGMLRCGGLLRASHTAQLSEEQIEDTFGGVSRVRERDMCTDLTAAGWGLRRAVHELDQRIHALVPQDRSVQHGFASCALHDAAFNVV